MSLDSRFQASMFHWQQNKFVLHCIGPPQAARVPGQEERDQAGEPAAPHHQLQHPAGREAQGELAQAVKCLEMRGK